MSGMKVVSDAYEAFGRGDIPAVVAVMDPGIHWHEAEGNPYRPSSQAWVGPEKVVNNLFRKLAGEWDSFALHPESFHDAGDVVVVELRYSGTYKATGKTIDAQVCHVWTVKDGKLTNFQQYMDTAKMQDVMGART